MPLKKLIWITLVCALLIPNLVLAQSFPVTVTVAWDMNADSDAVISYGVTLDSNAPATILATACSPQVRLCVASISVPNSSNHTASVTATNQWGTSAPTSITFRVSIPAPPVNVKVTK